MAIAIGSRLGSYEIVARIGAGGMGAVYRARDARLQRDVAIKVLPPEFASDEERLRRFRLEARAAGSLNDPHLVTVHEIGEADGQPYIVQELLEGRTLRHLIDDGPLSLRRAVDIATQVADGLAAAHGKGVVHRDVKPENIIVTTSGLVKILDFGLAKSLASASTPVDATVARETSPGIVMGTMQYMSPEQARGHDVDHRTDIFSLGVVLYEMLAGKRPFGGETAADVITSILGADPPPLDGDASLPMLDATVRRCLEKDRERRFQSAADLSFHLRSLPSRSGSMHAVGERRRRKWIGYAGLLAVGATAAAGAWALIGPKSTLPQLERLTFRRGTILNARYAPDGTTVVLGASFDGEPPSLYLKRADALDLAPFGVSDATLLSVSRHGDLAILLRPRRLIPYSMTGTLARVPLAGGTPRELLDNVTAADWSPDGRSIAIARRSGGGERLELREIDPSGTLQRPRVLFATQTGFISHVRFSPDGSRVAVGAHQRREATVGRLLVFFLSGGSPQELQPVRAFEGIGWSRDGKEVWASRGSGIVARPMNGRERTVLLHGGGAMVRDISSNGLLMSLDDVAQRIACGTADRGDRDLSWNGWTRAMDLSPDGREVLVQEYSPTTRSAVRAFDGSSLVELGRFEALAFAARQRRVLVRRTDSAPHFALVPVGAGEEVSLPPPGVGTIHFAVPAPDEQSIVFTGSTGDGPMHLYQQAVPSGRTRRLSGESLYFGVVAVAADGRHVAAVGPAQRITLYPLDGTAPRVLRATQPGDQPIRFAADGSLYVFRFPTLPTEIYQIDVATEAITPLRSIHAPDRAGVAFIAPRVVAPDGKRHCYQYVQQLSTLYSVRNVD